METTERKAGETRWVQGAHAGLVGEIVRWHGRYYVQGRGWSPLFEALCAEQLGEIARQWGERDEVTAFSAWRGDEFLAAVVMDARPGARAGARLRFLIASDAARGSGLGNQLLARAIAWAQARGEAAVWLTTVAGLEASSHLYRKYGFVLLEERHDRTWGDEHLEQLWERRIHSQP
jgi:GNAT superfamily N-acetyltransferase